MKHKLYILIGLFVLFQFSFSYNCVRLREYNVQDNKMTYGSEIIEGLDMETFELIDVHFSKDTNNVYYKGKKVLNVDSQSFIPTKTKEYNGYCDFSTNKVGILKLRIITEFKDKNGTYEVKNIKLEKQD